MAKYRVLSHTADTAIEAEAGSLSALIEDLAFGMFDLMFEAQAISPSRAVEIEVSSGSLPDLVVDTLAELLLTAEIRRLAFSHFSAFVDDEANVARIVAEGSALEGMELRGPPIKAVTYHDLEIARRGRRWYGRVVFDV